MTTLVDRSALDERIGGPVGEHAVRRGPWFNPGLWSIAAAVVLWVLTVWRQKPCEQHTAGNPVNAFVRLCYSDIPVAYQNTSLGRGFSALRIGGQNWAPLTRVFIGVTQQVSRVFGAKGTSNATAQQIVNGAYVFFLVATFLLFCSFLVTVGCVLLMGRDSARLMGTSARDRIRSWDALLVAAAPVVFTSGLVSWDMFTVALTTAALLAWALDRRVSAGVLFGLAITAGVWPVLVLAAIGLVCARARRVDAWARMAAVAAVVVAVVTVACSLAGPNPWQGVSSTWFARGADLGSFWFLVKAFGMSIKPGFLSVAVIALFVAWVGWVSLLTLAVAPRRPRIAQVAFLLVAGWLLLNKGYAPQQVLWLVPLVAMARPKRPDWIIWIAAEVVYWAAVWAHLGNMLTPGDGSPDVLYWAAIVLRVITLAWLCQRVAGDMRRPWEDPVRGPMVDDPIGGLLDHAADDELPDDGLAEDDPAPVTADLERG